MRLAVIASVSAVGLALPGLLATPAECLPSELLSGFCDPLPPQTILGVEAAVALAVFASMWTVGFATGLLLRAVRWLGARIRRQEATESSPPAARRRGFMRAALASRWTRVGLSGAIVFGAGVAAGRTIGAPADGQEFALIRQAWDVLHDHYVRPADLDPQAMAYAAIDGMTWAVGDEGHTVFLSPEDAQAAEAELSANADPVHWSMLPGTSIAFIRLDVFADGSSQAVADAVRQADRRGVTGLILDLRGNPGGGINEAVWVVSDFVAEGPAVRVRDRSGAIRIANVDGGVIDATTPMAVLIDNDSASAAEMVSAALQEAGRAVLVGEPTFGTGTGLAAFDLADGSLVEVGSGEWLTRDGRSVWHNGAQPDITVHTPAGSLLTPEAASTATVERLQQDNGLSAAVGWLQHRP